MVRILALLISIATSLTARAHEPTALFYSKNMNRFVLVENGFDLRSALAGLTRGETHKVVIGDLKIFVGPSTGLWSYPTGIVSVEVDPAGMITLVVSRWEVSSIGRRSIRFWRLPIGGTNPSDADVPLDPVPLFSGSPDELIRVTFDPATIYSKIRVFREPGSSIDIESLLNCEEQLVVRDPNAPKI